MFNENQNKIRFLDDLTDLQIRAKHLESKSQKGFEIDSDIEQEIEDLRNSCLEASSFVYENTGDESAKVISEKFRKPMSFNPQEIMLVLKDIVADISELYARAVNLMLENASRAKTPTAVSSSEKDEPARSLESQDKAFENQEMKTKEKINSKIDHSQEKDKVKDASKNTAKFEKPSQKGESLEGQREVKRPSNIVFVKNKTFESQRALAPSLSKQKAPVMSAPQMSM